MKISGYYKSKSNNVILKTDYENLNQFDKVCISKVFTDTKVNENILDLPNVEYGGTGFFYDEAPPLPYEIEHHMPDYDLYNDWVQARIDKAEDKKKEIKSLRFYLNYSIGFTTRGCFRGCYFCVNKNCTKSVIHSPVEEFLNPNKPYVLLLDDNMFACKDWKLILESLHKIKKAISIQTGIRREVNDKRKGRFIILSK